MNENKYIPFASEILEVVKHTELEYTFRMCYSGDVKPGQFFEVSLPKYGEAPISVSGIGEDHVDLTIRKVGKVTGEIFEQYVGSKLFLRGPYGNGFDVADYRGRELVVVAGGTGLSPVRGVVDYFAKNSDQVKRLTLVTGFKSPEDILFRKDIERWKKNTQVIVTVDAAEVDYQGNVGLVTEYIADLTLDHIGDAAAVVVGPPPMMKFTIIELLKRGFKEENIWISQERKMCCGIGKCGHCRVNDKYICLDGPVFNYTEGKSMVD